MDETRDKPVVLRALLQLPQALEFFGIVAGGYAADNHHHVLIPSLDKIDFLHQLTE